MQALSESGGGRRYPRTSAGMRYLGLLVLLALIATLSARLTGYRPASVAPSPVLKSRSLLFTDLSGGVIEVHDAEDKALLLRIEPGEEAVWPASDGPSTIAAIYRSSSIGWPMAAW